MYKQYLKQLTDKIVSLVLLLIFLPVCLLLIGVSYYSNGENPFFYQLRPGKNEKIFRLIKFKTMNDNRDIDGNLLPDERRLTKFGNFIRKTSLDEIPQLINVLLGDMSIVGPRPLLVQYLPLYSDLQKKRHDVKPGITGWAQINGRNAISWEKKFEYDVWYVDNVSFFLDIKILILTIKKIIIAEGITNGKDATTEGFNGKN